MSAEACLALCWRRCGAVFVIDSVRLFRACIFLLILCGSVAFSAYQPPVFESRDDVIPLWQGFSKLFVEFWLEPISVVHRKKSHHEKTKLNLFGSSSWKPSVIHREQSAEGAERSEHKVNSSQEHSRDNVLSDKYVKDVNENVQGPVPGRTRAGKLERRRILHSRTSLAHSPKHRRRGLSGFANELERGSVTQICSSRRVKCTKELKIVELNLAAMGLMGPIPSSFSLLTDLKVLNLSYNDFDGPIPTDLGKLSKLQVLDLSRNQLEGPVPLTFGYLASLNFLDLSHNNLSGSLPPQILGLENLSYLSVSFNQLHGPVLCYQNCSSRLVSLSIAHNNLSGAIPDSLGELRLLQVLDLSANSLGGPLPASLGNCSFLREIRLGGNAIEGEVPRELGELKALRLLDLSDNQFTGDIPEELCYCWQLEYLSLNYSSLKGPIPLAIGNLSSLSFLSISHSNLSGYLPSSIGSLEKLAVLDLEMNSIDGNIPSELGNCSMLQNLALSQNRLSGEIPTSFENLHQLKSISLERNFLTGRLPKWSENCDKLEEILMPMNYLAGSIPVEWSKLSALRILSLFDNDLEGDVENLPFSGPGSNYLEYLRLDNNRFSGSLPNWIANLSNLVVLSLANNLVYGSIPADLGNCRRLEYIFLGSNSLTDSVPSELGRLSGLVVLSLSFNHLTGMIPHQIGNCTSLKGFDLTGNELQGVPPIELSQLQDLQFLLLGSNNFSGKLPSWIVHFPNLQALDLSFNDFSGGIPEDLERLEFFGHKLKPGMQYTDVTLVGRKTDSLNLVPSSAIMGRTYLILASNKLTGELPAALGNLKNLWVVDVRNNMLTGSIPANLGIAQALTYLDLSMNSFGGSIPDSFSSLSFLSFLNVSNNRLVGQIPRSGQFDTFDANSFANNAGLCGLPLDVSCTPTSPVSPASAAPDLSLKADASWVTIVGMVVGIIVGSILVLWTIAAAIYWCKFWKRRRILTKVLAAHDFGSEENMREALSINVAMFEKLLQKVTLGDLLKATNNFDVQNIVGDGGFGMVYKAKLQDDTLVAVKRLSADGAEGGVHGGREFVAEMETLGKVKHTNLVPLLGYCSLGAHKILVYEYMPYGNLDFWLHSRAEGLKPLDWSCRLRITQGVARGLAFLHHVCIPHIVHRDIKASNILLDSKFEARVADFGLARLICAYDTHLSTNFAGTVGYIPPEYGQIPLATTRGDVYSFGIVLLELLTGKRPTDRSLLETEDYDLVSWVRSRILRNQLFQLFDDEIKITGVKEELINVLGLAVWCTEEVPSRRPTMLQIAGSIDKMLERRNSARYACKASCQEPGPVSIKSTNTME